MEIQTTIKWHEKYLPLNARKTTYITFSGVITNDIKEVEKKCLKHVFTDYYNDDRLVYLYKGKLYYERKNRFGNYENNVSIIDSLKFWHRISSVYFAKVKHYNGEFETKEEILQRLHDELKKYLIVDGVLYERLDGIPCYEIHTFGLGGNHGGTGLMVTYIKNWKQALRQRENKGWLFSALDYEKAIERAIQVATNRKDTNSIKYFKKRIEIFDEKIFK